ncbi:YchJ family metal-binding protein [Hoeflea alexandrii]|uniref:YchJ family metal-binding protein n=1 Tax=Hoeflea alexandrii TaxID=288436 RepID=UPI00227203F6|nr:YchJ family metal-binding protein [Hoeflea alexandrii]MCY0152794.1 YchJ family metal-binding protein [Hoeflea alexandrii]
MRSRYAAYALGRLDYITATCRQPRRRRLRCEGSGAVATGYKLAWARDRAEPQGQGSR